MKSRWRRTSSRLLFLLFGTAALWSLWHLQAPVPPGVGWGGKAEHCAMAIGVIGAAILSLFANPLAGPAAVGVMSLGLIWMVATCD